MTDEELREIEETVGFVPQTIHEAMYEQNVTALLAEVRRLQAEIGAGGWAREVLKVDAATTVLIRNTAIEECIADLAAAMDVESTSWPALIELVRMPRRRAPR